MGVTDREDSIHLPRVQEVCGTLWSTDDLERVFSKAKPDVKERLEAAKQGSTKGLGSPTSGASFAFGGAVGSRIAKPLRGGGASVQDGPVLPALSNLQQQESSGGGKRSSWFFNQR